MRPKPGCGVGGVALACGTSVAGAPVGAGDGVMKGRTTLGKRSGSRIGVALMDGVWGTAVGGTGGDAVGAGVPEDVGDAEAVGTAEVTGAADSVTAGDAEFPGDGAAVGSLDARCPARARTKTAAMLAAANVVVRPIPCRNAALAFLEQ